MILDLARCDYNARMVRLLVYIVILFDLAAWLGINLPLRGAHLDVATRHKLDRFNVIALAVLIVTLLIALFFCLFPARPARPASRWPQEPPE